MKRGFTLIEVLAVIVVLGIIALITIPNVLRIVNNSRKDSAVVSAKSYIESVKASIVQQVGNKKFKATYCDVTEEGNLTCDDETTYEIYAENKKPKEGRIFFNNKTVVNVLNLRFGKYLVSMDQNGEYYASLVERELSE